MVLIVVQGVDGVVYRRHTFVWVFPDIGGRYEICPLWFNYVSSLFYFNVVPACLRNIVYNFTSPNLCCWDVMFNYQFDDVIRCGVMSEGAYVALLKLYYQCWRTTGLVWSRMERVHQHYVMRLQWMSMSGFSVSYSWPFKNCSDGLIVPKAAVIDWL